MISLVAIISLFSLVSSNVSTTVQGKLLQYMISISIYNSLILVTILMDVESGESGESVWDSNYNIITANTFDDLPSTSSLYHLSLTSTDTFSTDVRMTSSFYDIIISSIQETASTSSDLLHPSTSLQETESTSNNLFNPFTSLQETASTSSDLVHPSSTSSDLLHPSSTSSDLLNLSTSLLETATTSSDLLNPSTSVDNSSTNVISTSFTYTSTISIQMPSLTTSSHHSFHTSSTYIIPTSIISISLSTYYNITSTTLIQKSSFITSNRSLYPSSTISRMVPSTSTTSSTKLTDYIGKYVLRYLFIWISVLSLLLICITCCCCCCCLFVLYARRKRTKAYTVQGM